MSRRVILHDLSKDFLPIVWKGGSFVYERTSYARNFYAKTTKSLVGGFRIIINRGCYNNAL